MLRLTALLTLLFASLAQPAAAQSMQVCVDQFERTRTERLGGAEPFFAIITQGALSRECNLVTFYALEQEDPGDFSKPTLYFAKQWLTPYEKEPQLRYADSRKCGNVRAALDAVSSFHFPRIRVPEEWPSDHVIVSTDGQYAGIWTNRLANSDDIESRDFLEFSLGDWNNDAFDRLANVVDTVLQPCWSTTPPAKP